MFKSLQRIHTKRHINRFILIDSIFTVEVSAAYGGRDFTCTPLAAILLEYHRRGIFKSSREIARIIKYLGTIGYNSSEYHLSHDNYWINATYPELDFSNKYNCIIQHLRHQPRGARSMPRH